MDAHKMERFSEKLKDYYNIKQFFMKSFQVEGEKGFFIEFPYYGSRKRAWITDLEIRNMTDEKLLDYIIRKLG